MNKHRKFNVYFKSQVEPELGWEFKPVQNKVIVNAGEPALMFYDAYNKTKEPMVGKLSPLGSLSYLCNTPLVMSLDRQLAYLWAKFSSS